MKLSKYIASDSKGFSLLLRQIYFRYVGCCHAKANVFIFTLKNLNKMNQQQTGISII